MRLTLTDVSVNRGSGLLFQDLSLDVAPGSIFWIVGPNGAGKSSLLRVMTGLDQPAGGDVAREAPEDTPFRYFHSEMALPGWSAVGAWHRLVKSLAPGLAPPTPVHPDVGPKRWVRRLSTGERKRLLLDALLRVPGSLLLDEPYEHLSPEAKDILTDHLRERARTAVVVVVTNQDRHLGPGEPGLRIEDGQVTPLEAA